ncbi:MAG TPA: cellulase family glycosylhydrolase, partial [Kofleriaceae bacterium]
MRFAALALLAACGSDSPRDTHPLRSDGTHLRDARGRIALLRGVNARVEGVFDAAFDDGRTALEPIPPLTDDDCHRMRQLGLDFLRLPINWSGIEPTEGMYSDAYLDRVDAAVQCAARAGILVMIDLHQDAYSKEIGEDGAPLWAIDPAPTQLLAGPLVDLGDRRTSAQVSNAFDTFFGADPTLRTKFYAVLDRVAARWATDPTVIGFEIFNEPPVGDNLVQPFSIEAAQHVRTAAPDKLVMFEPSAVRNLFDYSRPADAPFPVENAVYAPHVYTYVFAAMPVAFTAADLEASVANARAEATAWATPLMIGEYGIGPAQPNA